MNEFESERLVAAEEIGYKSYVKQLAYGITVAIVLVCGVALTVNMWRSDWGPHMRPLIFVILMMTVLVGIAVRRMWLFFKTPDCIVKKDEESLYFWHRGKWETLPLAEIKRVFLRMSRNSHSGGDIVIRTYDGRSYTILDVQNFDEVKTRIGVSGREQQKKHRAKARCFSL